ncbi:fimbria A protein [Klebsiella pneumoniae]|uniref:fimbrial protein n=1 Tax=Klebsiella pneumoniae TaxID=573 RepID=UPI000E2B0B6E|nr:fimbrial protein [Klebsiella pneumoniae]SXU74016.1 fimbria A protein [Klebsiella pneumoniae]HBV3482675.1 type 1 fimbrial protein [Klebsiella pneumoniae]
MKNMSLKVMSLAFIMTASSAAFADVNGGSGTIHFTGTVIDAPCSIAPESIEQTVELGSVALSSLKTAGSHSRPATGEIKLVDCTLTSVEGDETTTYSKVGVTFSGIPDATVAALLANDSSAQGVGVRLLDQDGKAIELGSETEYPLGNGATIIYQAYVEANGNTVTAGDIRSDATFKLNYK